MISFSGFFLALAGVILAPAAGALISGIDRKLTAWFQGRVGPPVRQPFLDVIKLLSKEYVPVNSRQSICVLIYFVSSLCALLLFLLGQDLLLIFFILSIGAVSFVTGAMSAPSPFSQVGAQRELIQILTYEPLLLLAFVGFFLVTGSFNTAHIAAWDQPLLFELPLVYLALGLGLTIKLRKSPFDLSASHHGHQELVKGSLTDFSGPQLAFIELAHWYEIILFLGVISLFWSTSVPAMLILTAVTYMGEIVVDNLTARSTWRWMILRIWPLSLGLVIINFIHVLTF